MALHRTIIDVSDLPELRRIAEEVRDTQEPAILRTDDEEIAMITPIDHQEYRPRRALTQQQIDVVMSAAGGWKGLVDGEKLKAEIEAARGSNRPPVEL